ncbi:hypothetical protein B6U96_10975 [Archaeoglobales archaeon ex4484_92]|nr:MAG: hypothetical protein B6U96_10975 [Archaeoglobales archaeon ex4484_92]
MNVYKTGITPLDAQLGGGIPSGSVVLILEEPGAGADVLSYHFAVEGAKSHENVLYFATDDSEDEIRNYINLYFNLDNASWEFITLLSLTSFRKKEPDAKIFLRKTMYDPLSGLKTILQHEEFKRVIINNLTYFLVNYELYDVVSLIGTFSEYAKRVGSSFLVLMTKGMFELGTETSIKHYSDGVIELSLREAENEMQRRLKVIKFKGILVPKAILRYDLTEKGIKMESLMRVL